MGYQQRMRVVFLLLASAVLWACNCKQVPPLNVIQRDDKKLSCKQLVLEMNEVERQRGIAGNQRTPAFEHLYMPLCYPSTYKSAADAMTEASQRLEYLSTIYELNGCDAGAVPSAAANPAAP